MEQLGSVLVKARNEKRNAKGPAHDGLLSVSTLAEAQGEVADGLRAALDTQGLVVVEGVALALDAGVLNHGPGIGLETRHGAANVAVDLDNLLDGGGFEEGGGDSLFDTQDDAFGGGDADGGGAELDCLERVFDLEETAFGGEGVDTPIWRWERVQLARGILNILAVCWCNYMAACLFLHFKDTSASSCAVPRASATRRRGKTRARERDACRIQILP